MRNPLSAVLCSFCSPPLSEPLPFSWMQIRAKELYHQWWVALIKTTQIMIVFGTPPACALIIFSSYEMASGKRLTSTLTFPIL